MSATINRSQATTTPVRTQESIVTSPLARAVLAISRIVIGFYFLWAFLDKTFGLGFSTPAERAWVNGGAPAQGFLGGVVAADGPFSGFFALFQNPFGDAFFMIALAGIGIAMIAGAGVRIAGIGGAVLMFLMYLAALPWLAESATNPIVDSHWMEALLLLLVPATLAGDTWGLGRWWGSLPLVRRHAWLR